MRKMIAILLTLGILLVGAGTVSAAPLSITANVLSTLSLQLSALSLEFDDVQPGVPSEAQTLTTTATGNDTSYQLTLTGASFTASGATQPATVLQFKESAAGTYKNASTTAQNMLTAASTATVAGDAQAFNLRVNFPLSAVNGAYAATITITAVPQV